MRAAIISLSTLVVFLTAGGITAYDASRDDLIATGVTVGGIDIGGLRAGEVRVLLDRRLARPLERPMSVEVEGRRFSLPARRARVTVDVEASVQDALAKSRQGGPLSRLARDLSKEPLGADLSPRVTHSRGAVRSFARRVKRAFDRPARDARLRYSATGLRRVRSKAGATLSARRLERRLSTELALPDGDRRVTARLKTVEPKVSTRELAARYPTFITVDRKRFELRFFQKLRLVKKYRIAVGKVGLETPAGLYNVQNKAIDPAWSVPDREWAGDLAGKVIPGATPENPIKARWMGIYSGAGIHGTDDTASLGTNASHGCIRMSIPAVKQLYRSVEVETPVFIA